MICVDLLYVYVFLYACMSSELQSFIFSVRLAKYTTESSPFQWHPSAVAVYTYIAILRRL